MRYRIAAESAHRIRIRLCVPSLSKEQAEIIKFAFSSVDGVTKVTVYPATAGCAFEYSCEKEEITRRLDAFRFENVTMLAEEELSRISADEMKSRKLDPALKRRLRMRILAESVADTVLPMPVQIGYHIYQMITLQEF